MIDIKYRNAMAEVIEYLKGIRKEDVDKIPNKLITFLKENASKNYKCEFDYNRPMKEQKLLDETKGIISMICLNYWCETNEQKQNFIKKLNENEIKYQEELTKIYNTENLFKKKEIFLNSEEADQNVAMIKYKENIFQKIINKIKKYIKSI